MGVQEDEVEGVLKLHSKILENHQLKKLDKCEKGLVNAIHLTGKGRSRLLNDINKKKVFPATGQWTFFTYVQGFTKKTTVRH